MGLNMGGIGGDIGPNMGMIGCGMNGMAMPMGDGGSFGGRGRGGVRGRGRGENQGARGGGRFGLPSSTFLAQSAKAVTATQVSLSVHTQHKILYNTQFGNIAQRR